MKVLIVDDEPLARDRLRRMISRVDGYEVVSEAGNGVEAIQQCNAFSPEIVFMDIRMPQMDGLAAAKELATSDISPAVIFCTAYGDYALQAFEANAVAYVVKPVNQEKLEEVLAKASRMTKAQLAAIKKETSEDPELNHRSHISSSSQRGIELVPVSEVRFFMADNKYVTAVHGDGEVLIDDTLKDLEEEFGSRFVRVHRNALVSLHHIEGLERNSQGQYQVKLKGIEGSPIVSRRHVSSLRKLLQKI